MDEYINSFANLNKASAIYLHQQISNEWFLETMLIFSKYVGNFRYAPVTFSLILITLIINIKTSKDKNKTFDQSIRCFSVMLASQMIVALLILFMKNYFAMPRPFCSLPIDDLINLTMHKMKKCFTSFPSGHSAYTTLVVASLFPIINKSLKVISIMILTTVYVSRVALAMHFPVDVLTSAMISLSAVYLMFKTYPIFEKIFNKPIKIIKKLLIS